VRFTRAGVVGCTPVKRSVELGHVSFLDGFENDRSLIHFSL
jgi:hypothetical protein